jgi:hypothetical protein
MIKSQYYEIDTFWRPKHFNHNFKSVILSTYILGQANKLASNTADRVRRKLLRLRQLDLFYKVPACKHIHGVNRQRQQIYGHWPLLDLSLSIFSTTLCIISFFVIFDLSLLRSLLTYKGFYSGKFVFSSFFHLFSAQLLNSSVNLLRSMQLRWFFFHEQLPGVIF